MQKKTYGTALKISVASAFLLMVTVNAIANLLPLNGRSTGQVSEALSQFCFAPTGLTFSIWGVIYLLLACYTLYQFGLFQKSSRPDPEFMHTIAIFFYCFVPCKYILDICMALSANPPINAFDGCYPNLSCPY